MAGSNYVSPSDAALLKSLGQTMGEDAVNKAFGSEILAKSHLVPKIVIVNRGGKTFKQTFYINPGDEVTAVTFSGDKRGTIGNISEKNSRNPYHMEFKYKQDDNQDHVTNIGAHIISQVHKAPAKEEEIKTPVMKMPHKPRNTHYGTEHAWEGKKNGYTVKVVPVEHFSETGPYRYMLIDSKHEYTHSNILSPENNGEFDTVEEAAYHAEQQILTRTSNKKPASKPASKSKVTYEKLGPSVRIGENARPYESNGEKALKVFLRNIKATDKVDTYSNLPGGSWIATISGGSLCESLGADYIEFGGGDVMLGGGKSRRYETTVYAYQPYKASQPTKEQTPDDKFKSELIGYGFTGPDAKIIISAYKEAPEAGKTPREYLLHSGFTFQEVNVIEKLKTGTTTESQFEKDLASAKYSDDDINTILTAYTQKNTKDYLLGQGFTHDDIKEIEKLKQHEASSKPTKASEQPKQLQTGAPKTSSDLGKYKDLMTNGGKTAVISQAKKDGVQWKEHENPNVNWMRAVMAIKKFSEK